VHSNEPEFYFRPSDEREPQLTLVRADVKGDTRELMATSRDLVGDESYKRNEVSLTSWDAARGVYRFTVDRALEPGEYAVLETTDAGVAGYVWDFGVEPVSKTSSPSSPSQAKPKAP
jgi:hypothetical protein